MIDTFKVGLVTQAKHSKFFWAISDNLVLIKRSTLHIFRSKDQLLGAVLQPIMFMVLFRYVFGGAVNTGGVSYVNFLVAGILVQTAAFGGTFTATEVANDLQKGIMDRFKSLPMLDSSVLVGHVVADLVRNTISIIIMIIVALLVGFRPTASVLDWVMILGLLLTFTFAISWASAVLGIVAKSVEAVQWMTFMTIFPLTFASSAFVPTNSMPGILKVFAENQPVTHVIDAIRALMLGTPIGDHGWIALAWCVAIIIISFILVTILFRRSTRAT
jgi:ABC-2 type transport system permease protein